MKHLGMKLINFATVTLGVFLLSLGTAYAQQFGSVVVSSERIAEGGPPGPSCAGGEIHDDGVPETSFGWISEVTDGMFADPFSPDSGFTYTEACVCLHGGDGTLNYEIEVWDDSGPGGGPGVSLGSVPAQATGVPAGLPGAWYSTDISSLGLEVGGGDTVYIGIRWDPSVEVGFFVCVDDSAGTPQINGHGRSNISVDWFDIPSSGFGDFYRSFLLRANGEPTDPVASFQVYKDFDDNNTGGVEIEIECTTGDPISSDATLYEFHDIFDLIEFKVQDFDNGELDCTITEDVPDGYEVTYCPGGSQSCNDTGCTYEEVEWGESFSCEITNHLQEVDVYVDKVWLDDQAVENGAHLFAGAKWECDPVADFGNRGFFNGGDHGFLWFVDPSTDSPGVFSDWDWFSFFPHFEGSTCSVTEAELDSDVLSDDSDCDDLEIFPGYEADLDEDDNPVPICTIINTRVYAGIPTLGDYGLVLLALLMLGVGFVGHRRFA